MRLDTGSLSFGSVVTAGGGTPAWATAFGYKDGVYKFDIAGYESILNGLTYCSVPAWCVSCRLGKGGAVVDGGDSVNIQQAALFKKVRINGISINYPFIALMVFDTSNSHNGRRWLKYSRTTKLYGSISNGAITYEHVAGGHELYSNENFFAQAEIALGITNGGCWFVHQLDVVNQDELELKAIIVNAAGTESYATCAARNAQWDAMVLPPAVFKAAHFFSDVNNRAVGLSYSQSLVERFVSALQAKPFVVLTGLSGSGKTKIAQAFVRWIGTKQTAADYPFKRGGFVQGAQSRYLILDVDRLGAVFSQPGGGQTMIPFEIAEEWADYMAKTPGADNVASQQLANDIKTNYPTKYSGAIHSFHSLLKPMAQRLNMVGMQMRSVITDLLVPVGADWTNSEKLLGYPNALDKTSYVMPDTGVLKLLLDAEKNPKLPFFLILDEMNLSHVERYFADFLSAMESGDEIKLYDGDQRYGDAEKTIAIPRKIRVPKNLFVIGTMNVDETTYMFSPKVLDRAQVIEFRVKEDEMAKFVGYWQDAKGNIVAEGTPGAQWKMASTKVDLSKLADANGIGKGAKYAESFLSIALARGEKKPSDQVISAGQPDAGKIPLHEIAKTLNAFFKPLADLGAEFGYRSASEILAFCGYYLDTGATIDAAIDAAIVQKLLPKLHGSRRKLDQVLPVLWNLCLKANVTDELDAVAKAKAQYDFTAQTKYPLSAEKVLRMYRAAIANGFASFAEA